MGFSASGALVVLFIGLLVSASYLYPSLEASVDRTHDASDAAEARLLRVQNTDFTLDSAEHDPANETLMIRVTNTGTTTLTVARVDTLSAGVYVDAVAFDGGATMAQVDSVLASPTGHEEPTLWLPGETLVFGWRESTNPDRVTVVTETGRARASAVVVV